MRFANTFIRFATMKKTAFIFLSSVAGMLVLTACPKHEIIPAPTKKVELTGHLIGNINGTDVELTEGVDNYSVSPSRALYQLPSPQPSSAIYYSEMKSSNSLVSVKIGVGSLMFDASVTSVPTLTQFSNFFNGLLTTDPPYTDGAVDGFAVFYRDGTGTNWFSRSIDPAPAVHFISVTQESDATADYMKFDMNFSCNVYRYTTAPTPGQPGHFDTTWYNLPLTDVSYQGWFTR